MDKIIRLVPILAFLAFLTKIMVLAPSLPDALVLSALISYVVLDQLRLKDAKFTAIAQKTEDLEKINKKFQEDIRNLQTSVSSMKMSTGLRPATNKISDKGF